MFVGDLLREALPPARAAAAVRRRGVFADDERVQPRGPRLEHLILPVIVAVGAGDRDLQPVHAHRHARDAELRLPAHRAGEGHLGEARDLPPRVPQRADPARRRSRRSTSVRSPAVSIITEQIFGYPGMGLYFLVNAYHNADYSGAPAVDDDRDRLRRRLQRARRPRRTRGSTRGSVLTDLQRSPRSEPQAAVHGAWTGRLDDLDRGARSRDEARSRRSASPGVASAGTSSRWSARWCCIIITFMCVFAPLFTKYGPTRSDPVNGVKGRSAPAARPLVRHRTSGATTCGRTCLYGGRVSLAVGIVGRGHRRASFGTIVGVLAGYYGGWLDNLLMRVTDLFLAIPFLIARDPAEQPADDARRGRARSWDRRTACGPVIFVIAVFFWMPVARIVRGLVLSLKEKEFVEAARAAGASNVRIMCAPPACRTAPARSSSTRRCRSRPRSSPSRRCRSSASASTSFTPTWGNLLSTSQGYLDTYPFLVWAPASRSCSPCLCVNFIGDGLRDALDPKQLSV